MVVERYFCAVRDESTKKWYTKVIKFFTMKKIISTALFSLSIALFPLAALALGSGGGGSLPAATSPSESPAVVTLPADAPAAKSEAPEKTIVPSKPSGNWLVNAALERPRKLYCTQKKMVDRIRCRLSMSDDEIAQENSILYLPEECRALPKKNQAACIDRYKKLQTCWDKTDGPDRIACASDVLGIDGSLASDVEVCSAKTGPAQKSCINTLKTEIGNLAKFRLYDLSERAEDTRKPGSDINPVVTLVNTMETLKQQFNKTSSVAVQMQVLKKAQAAWKQFVKVVPEAGADDNLASSIDDLQSIK